jgi:hypothetical protein
MVTSLTLTFSAPVTLAAGALTLTRSNPDNTNTPNPITLTPSSNNTTYTLTFNNQSLSDGIYDLTLHSSLITDTWNNPLQGPDQTTTFHRLYGDADGNGTINVADLGTFASFYGATTANPNFPAYLDADNNGAIDIADLGTFASNYGKIYSY